MDTKYNIHRKHNFKYTTQKSHNFLSKDCCLNVDYFVKRQLMINNFTFGVLLLFYATSVLLELEY